jgi:hypothetical protein
MTYQIKLGPMLWDCTENRFRSLDKWDVEGSHITPRVIARELNRAMDKTTNLHGWTMEIIRNGKGES